MTLWYVPGQGIVDDQVDGASIPTYGYYDTPGGRIEWGVPGTVPVPQYSLPHQYGDQSTFQWMPGQFKQEWLPGLSSYNVNYIPQLIEMGEASRAGTLKDYERWQYDEMRQQAMAIPTRDWSQLQAGYPGEGGDWSQYLTPASPDAGAIMLQLDERVRSGQASPQEAQLYHTFLAQMRDQNWRASVPQASDAFNPLGDNLFGALTILGIGAGMGGLGAGLATLPGLASAAGTTGTITGMMGQALDSKALKLAGMGLGMAGGAASLGNLASHGVSSVGDALKLAQKVYSLGSKGYSMAQLAGREDPAQAGLRDPSERLYSLDPSYAGRQLGSRSQALTSGSSSASGSGGGGSMDTNELGALLSAIVGGVGTSLSLVDAARYMGQLKDLYGDEQGIKALIDSAYQLATSRYEQYYASTLQQQQQQQENYADAYAKYQKHYQDTQLEQAQRQEAYGEQRGQIAEDRTRAIANWEKGIKKFDENFAERERMAREDRDRRIQIFGEDRQLAQADYQRRVAEAQQERQLDLAGYQARHGIGAGLRDPAQIVAGAKGLYNPLSDLAREMISRNVQGEMAMRGVSGQGQHANIMSARAFAPLEQEMWQNALQGWLQSQQTAIGAYGNMDLASSPEYEYAQVPNMGGIPGYEIQNTPAFARQSGANVPGAVDLPRPPGVPTAVPTGQAPQYPRGYLPRPYAPFGSSPTAGGSALKGVGDYVSNLTKMVSEGGPLAGLAKKFLSMLGLGGETQVPASFLSWDQPYGPGSSGDPAYAYSDDPYGYLYEGNSSYGPWASDYQYDDFSQYGPYLPEYSFPDDVVPPLDLSSW